MSRISKSLAAAALAIICSPTHAATWIVPGTFTTIQQTIAAAASLDEIIVSPGTYFENLNFMGKSILLHTSQSDPMNTTLNGRGAGPVITFSGLETSLCEVTGFTITNGNASFGGAIFGNNTKATITGNVITGNNGGLGGGIHGCGGLITANTITNNTATWGAGLATCTGHITSNIITGNTATIDGGGLYECSGTVESNTITGNAAQSHGGALCNCNGGIIRKNTIQLNTVSGLGGSGGGLFNCSPLIDSNVISSNVAQSSGGGMASCTGMIWNNTIYVNSADIGGGLQACNGVLACNSIFNNDATSVGGGFAACGSPTNCIIWNNGAPSGSQVSADTGTPSFCDIENWVGGGDNNLTTDPLFINAGGGNFHLAANSPCIDAGTTIPGLDHDFEGDPRPVVASLIPAGDGSNFDIGADEVVPVPPSHTDLAATWLTTPTVTCRGPANRMRCTLKGTVRIQNLGNTTAKSSTLSIYLSDDTVPTSADKVIKSSPAGQLRGGASKNVTLNYSVPQGTSISGKFVIAFVDSGNTVPESNEENNIAVAGPLP